VRLRTAIDELDSVTPIDIEVILLTEPYGAMFVSMEEQGVLTLELRKILDGVHSVSAPIKVISKQVFAARDGTERALLLLLASPDEGFRRARAKEAILRAVDAGRRNGTMGSHFADGVLQHIDELVDQFLVVVHENDAGRFSLEAVYRSDREGTWQGEVRSRPVMFEIQYKETALDRFLSPSWGEKQESDV
jgi:hypothetical protein